MALWSNRARYQYPVSPGNKASILSVITEPSHRTVGDMLTIGFEADPGVVRAYVPSALTTDPTGLCYLRLFDACVYTDRNTSDLLSPERYEFTEAFFWIPCTYEGALYHYMLYSWVNRDWLAYSGRSTGVPHKLAKVQLMRLHSADPVFGSPAAGVRLSFSVENVGLVMRGWIDLRREVARGDPALPISMRQPAPKYLGHRYFWDVAEQRPLVTDLVSHWGDQRQPGPIWEGDACLCFFEAEGEDVLPFQPRRVVGAWWHTMSFHHKISAPEIIATVPTSESEPGRPSGASPPSSPRPAYPRTRTGSADLFNPLTQHERRVVSDNLTIWFDADSDVVRAYLPEPLQNDAGGRCCVRVRDACVFSDRNRTELISPERHEFASASLLIPCTYRGQAYEYEVFSFVNRDWMAYVGRMAGSPYKIATVALMRFHPADSVYDGPREGVRVSFVVETVGLAMRGYVDLQHAAVSPAGPPSVGGDCHIMRLGRRFGWDKVADRPMVDDLLAVATNERQIGPVWDGAASLTFYAAEGEDLVPFTPASMIGGQWHTSSTAGDVSQYESIHSFNDQ